MIWKSSQLHIVALICMAMPQMTLAQRTQPPSGSTGRTSAPARIPTTPEPSIQQPVFISGRVVLESGAPVPEPVAIERMCNGVTRREGYTDFKGQFQLQVGQNPGFQDASENDPQGMPGIPPRLTGQTGFRTAQNYFGCEFRAVLAGYQSSTIMLRNSGDQFQMDLGTIVLTKMGDVKGMTVSATSMAAPRDAKRAFERAEKAISQKKLEQAEKELNKAVSKYPEFATAWCLLGDLHQQKNNLEQASQEYAKALAADPQYVNPVYGLAIIAVQEKKWEEAVRLTAQVAGMNAYAFPAAYFYNAAANYNAGKIDAAAESANKFKSIDTGHRHPEVSLLLSQIMLRRQDYGGAAREIREYLAIVPKAPNAAELARQADSYEQLSMAKKR